MWQLDDIHELLETDETLTCIRQGRDVTGDVTYIDGLPIATRAARRFDIVCTIQPMGGRDLLLQPEAFRTKDMLSCWQAHRTAAEDIIRLDVSDIVLFRGTAYQVQGAEDWESYTKATLCAVDVGSYAGVIDPDHLPTLYPAADDAPATAPLDGPGPIPPPATSAEERDMDVGPITINQFFNPGDVQDFRIPGDGTTTFRYRFPRGGKVTGYTVTGQATTSPYGAYLTRRPIDTGVTHDAVFVDPQTQRGYDQDAGTQVVFDSPCVCNQGDTVTLKWKIKDGNFGQVDVAAFLQVTLDPATSA